MVCSGFPGVWYVDSLKCRSFKTLNAMGTATTGTTRPYVCGVYVHGDRGVCYFEIWQRKQAV